MYGLYQQVQERCHHLHTPQAGLRCCLPGTSVAPEQVNDARRAFLSTTAVFAATAALKAQEKKVDGGLAIIEDKKIPERATPITPPAH